MRETPTTTPPRTRVPPPRVLTIEDVHKTIGALYIEVDQLRRENAQLRAALGEGSPTESPDGDQPA